MEYPLYRKLSSGRSYYKIISEIEFIEIQFIGSRYLIHNFKISQYPDKLFLKELISLNSPYEKIPKEEVEKYLTLEK